MDTDKRRWYNCIRSKWGVLMEPYKENLINHSQHFPVDIFIQDNLRSHIMVKPHWHDCYEILYMLDGAAVQQINDKNFNAEKHDLIILNEGDIHSTYCAEGEDTRILVIKFLSDIIDGSFNRIFESKYILPFLNHKSGNIFRLSETPENSKNLYNLMMGLFQEFTGKDTGYEIYIKGYIYQLIAGLVRNGIINVYNPAVKENDMLKLDILLKYIEKNYYMKIDLKKAANMLNLSSSYFSRYFKRITGKTFKEYINFVKICEVEKHIISTDMNISQAAYEAGFTNITSFNRIFKRVRGYSPGNIKRSKTAKE